MIADTYESKHKLLHATSGPSDSENCLPYVLQEVIDSHEVYGKPAAEFSSSELHAIAHLDSSQAEDDADPGPYEAWCKGNASWWVSDSCMLTHIAGMCERGYVFWDEARSRSHQNGIAERPEDEPRDTDAGQEDMMESFRERSEIWQKGGRGYWSRDDASRIIWPRGVPPSS